MKKFRKVACLVLVALEGALTTIPFLLAWWAGALYRSVLAGWEVSGMKTADKRVALAKLMGDDDHAG